MEAHELVADAAIGLIDSVDLIGPSDVEGTAVLYHHLLSCGLRLAATVGTDVWLSYSRGPLLSTRPDGDGSTPTCGARPLAAGLAGPVRGAARRA
jgi:hypothetical protein